jgi:hypothetical protein
LSATGKSGFDGLNRTAGGFGNGLIRLSWFMISSSTEGSPELETTWMSVNTPS